MQARCHASQARVVFQPGLTKAAGRAQLSTQAAQFFCTGFSDLNFSTQWLANGRLDLKPAQIERQDWDGPHGHKQSTEDFQSVNFGWLVFCVTHVLFPVHYWFWCL
jgi:hypothetical protein